MSLLGGMLNSTRSLFGGVSVQHLSKVQRKMTVAFFQQSERTAIDEQYGFFHLERGRVTIDLSGSNLINVLSEYESYNQRMHPGYSNLSVRSKLQELCEAYQFNLMPWRVDEEFYIRFYLFCTEYSSEPLRPSTVLVYCNLIRSALRWGMRHRVEVSDTFDLFEFPKYSRTKVALNPDEISYIYHFDFRTWNKAQPKGHRIRKDLVATFERVRDQFVLSCLLGQRYSDMKRICPEWFNEQRTTMKVPCQQKTGNQAVVDIQKLSVHPKMAYEILSRYDYCSPYPYTIQDYNRYLHRLLQIIGGPFMERTIHSENKVNGKVISEDIPMYQAISSHTGRRTFITNAVLKGIPENAVRKASGHKDVSSFVKYIIDDED